MQSQSCQAWSSCGLLDSENMIKKVLSITNVGRLQSCIPVGDVEFRRLTLIYAENGHGKTTLCDLLRSLGEGDASLLTGRSTLGAPGRPQAEIRIEGGTVRFSDGAWTRQLPELRIYDTRFIHENIYAGDVVGHEHKKRLYRVIIGEDSVQLVRRIEELDEQGRQLSRESAACETALTAHRPPGMTVEAFAALELRDSLPSEIAQAEAKVRELRNAQEITAHTTLQIVAGLPPVPSAIEEVLSRSVDGLARDVERRVEEHLAHRMGQRDSSWLARGTTIASSEGCPLCAQPLSSSPIFTDLKSYFGAAYQALKGEVEELRKRSESFIGELELQALSRDVERNGELGRYWSPLLPQTALPELQVEPIVNTVRELRSALIDLLSRKQNALLEQISLPQSVAETIEAYAACADQISTYNDQVRRYADAVDSKKRALAAGNLAAEENNLSRLQAAVTRHETAVSAVCAEWAELRRRKDAAAQEKQAARRDLERFTEDVLHRYQANINDLLSRSGAAFSIVGTESRHVGGKPSTNFRIQINQTSVDLGDDATPASQPSFRNTLSSGDRSALALAFFLASTLRDPSLADKIIVLDDPFTSQDRGRRHWTCNQIQMLAHRAKQVIVLSHDQYFLHDVAEHIPPDLLKTIQIAHFGPQSNIREWHPSEECLEQHAKDHRLILRYSETGEDNFLQVRAALRSLLENYLYMRLPDQFPGKATLGDMIGAIRAAAPGDSKAPAQTLLEELTAINDYSVGAHHRTRIPETQDTNELKAFCNRTLQLVRGFSA
jgi:wobble nucleotide-excising tRNase